MLERSLATNPDMSVAITAGKVGFLAACVPMMVLMAEDGRTATPKSSKPLSAKVAKVWMIGLVCRLVVRTC